MNTKRKYTDEQFIQAVANNQTIRCVLKELGLKPAGGNYKVLHHRIKTLGLDTSHWTGQAHLEGKHHNYNPPVPLEKILVENSNYGSFQLKNRLLQEGRLERRCYECNLTEWRGKPVPVELEHKNGNKYDNREENLTLLCPNCHALTPTYRGKNKKKEKTLG